MKLIAQTLPDLKEIFACNPGSSNCPVTRTPGALTFNSLGDIVYYGLNTALGIAAFLSFFWLVWAAFQYITAGGEKQKLAEARGRITWAIVGFLLVAIAFLVAQFVARILPPQTAVPIL